MALSSLELTAKVREILTKNITNKDSHLFASWFPSVKAGSLEEVFSDIWPRIYEKYEEDGQEIHEQVFDPEWKPPAVPRYRTGNTLPDSIEEAINNDEELVNVTLDRVAHDMALAIADRYNFSCLEYMSSSTLIPADLVIEKANVENFIESVMQLTIDVGPDGYGELYDHLVLSTRLFKKVINSEAYKKRLNNSSLRYAFGAAAISSKDLHQHKGILSNILNLEIVLEDTTYWKRLPDGTKSRTRVLGQNTVLVSNSADHGNRNCFSFALAANTRENTSQNLDRSLKNSKEVVSWFEKAPNPLDNTKTRYSAYVSMAGRPRIHRETAVGRIEFLD